MKSLDNVGVSLSILTRTDELKRKLQMNDIEIKIEKAKQDIGLHITFSAFRFALWMLESPGFLQYCMV